MKANVGMADKVIRLLGAIILIIFFYKGLLTGIWGIIGLIVSLLLTVTSLIGYCPVYLLFGINTSSIEKSMKKSAK